VVEAMRAMTKSAELLEVNIRAIEAGYEFARANAAEEKFGEFDRQPSSAVIMLQVE
jgi:Pyruvate/2-oxoacid:ferredoxin oxidoreductase gamma subunit